MNYKPLIVLGSAYVLYRFFAVKDWQTILKPFFKTWESFSSSPYWDVVRYSWGYGTPAPGPTGIITEIQAWKDAIAHLQNDKEYLETLINRPLNSNQWAALLSFSYNLGQGNADNLVYNINTGNNTGLKIQWLLYNKINGVYSQHQQDRRIAEWELWIS